MLANALGGSWTAVLSLAVIPFEIRFLGPESYAVLAFIASIQITLSVLDLGLSPTIARVVATDASPGASETRKLVQAIWFPYSIVGLLIGVVLFGASHWLAVDWLHLQSLPADTATRALRFGALMICLRWPVSFYANVLAGKQRFDLLNLARASVTTVTTFGIIAIVLATRSLPAVTAWMALSAFVEMLCYAATCKHVIPRMTFLPRMSMSAFGQVWRFSLGMNLINVFSIALTQSDRLIISRLLPAEALGYYSLAYNVVLGLSLVQGFVTSAMFPAFAADDREGRGDRLLIRYRKSSEALIALYVLPVGLLTFFGGAILRAATNPRAATAAAPLLAVLAIGFLFNAAMSIPYTLATATGHTRIPVAVNGASLLLYVPLLYVGVERWGSLGAALTWLALNLSYLLTLLPLVQHRVAHASVWRWLARVLTPFVLAGAASFGGARLVTIVAGWQQPAPLTATVIVGVISYCALAFFLLEKDLKEDVRRVIVGFARRGLHGLS
ncbi:MAG: lipopolysaccharide biosynthesis protein [Chloroflexota bacterium]